MSSEAPAAAGPQVADAQPEPNTPEPSASVSAAAKPRSRRNFWLAIIGGVIALDVLAFVVIPPYPAGSPGQPVSGIVDLITANFEFPAPPVVWDLAPDSAPPADAIVFFHPSISASILTTWFVMAFIIVLAFLATRRLRLVPGPVANAIEAVYEALQNFAISLGGDAAKRYVPLFAGVFLFVLISNWSGLLPIAGKIEFVRAPTSDVNVTIGMALVSFVIFEFEGFRRLGVRGYLGKFFNFGAFREGIGAGLIALYVGIIEFALEFIKPVTLAMRLFGNIFGGEVAIGVITALTIAVIPTAIIGLEVLLNFVQALIFSTLTLMYTLIAIEGHGDEHAAKEAPIPEGNIGVPLPQHGQATTAT